MIKSEFTVENSRQYDHRSGLRWILSHAWQHKVFVLSTLLLGIVSQILFAQGPVLIGQAAEVIINPTVGSTLLPRIAITILIVLVLQGVADLIHSLTLETLAQRLEASTREELYRSLLGKSQTFHDRQRVGNIMALVSDDVQQLNFMMNPGLSFIFNTVVGMAIPIIFIGLIRFDLLLVPVVFVIAYIISVRVYTLQLNPVAGKERNQSAKTNTVLEETITGIEVVKASAQEAFERRRFRRNARLFRDYFVRRGYVESRYLPLLLYAVAIGAGFLQCIILNRAGLLSVPQIIAYMGLLNVLRFPTFISIFSFSLVQLGIASADRILGVIRVETDLDENAGGFSAPIKGDIVFEHVSFGYDDGGNLLNDISFHVKPGETVAIVGQTGSGKSTLTQLINRTYDVTAGRILIDGHDVREWDLSSLRPQISTIEQDIFLFSRSLSENIAFGAPNATQEQIEQAAKEAQAHDFIGQFAEGYATKVGERGVTLSGGQRQRIALARAFLSNPRILILDDSTSAIDSATEDEIQKAIQRAQQGRTTLLITHRLSQIRWADHILVLDRGELVASGTHDELLRRSTHYRRIFARYDVELPPLEPALAPAQQ